MNNIYFSSVEIYRNKLVGLVYKSEHTTNISIIGISTEGATSEFYQMQTIIIRINRGYIS